MHHVPSAILSTVAAVVALTAPGCSNHDQSRSISEPVTPPATVTAPPADSGPLPTPGALTDVMYGLADPAVPGRDKLPLVQNVAPSEAATLEAFATALRDGGFTPVTFEATDIRWSDTQPGDALATIKVTTTNPKNPGEFAFRMEFRPAGGGWQLSRKTADVLLAFDDTHAVGVPPR
jgi:hypothetical protein